MYELYADQLIVKLHMNGARSTTSFKNERKQIHTYIIRIIIIIRLSVSAVVNIPLKGKCGRLTQHF